MWWLISIGIFGLGVLCEAVSSNEREARQRWESKRQDVEKTIEDHQKNIEIHIAQAQCSYDFHFLADLHYSSVKTADAAYKLLDDANSSLDGMNKMLTKAKAQKILLQNNLEKAKQEKNKAVIYETIEQLKMVNELRKSIFDDKDKVKSQRAALLKEVQQLNNQTRELKECIKNRCGAGGLSWFNKLEDRKRNRRLFEKTSF